MTQLLVMLKIVRSFNDVVISFAWDLNTFRRLVRQQEAIALIEI